MELVIERGSKIEREREEERKREISTKIKALIENAKLWDQLELIRDGNN